MTLAIFGILAINNWKIVTENYKINEQIYYQNIARIEKFANSDQQEGQLILLEPHDFKYGFNKFVGIDWIESAVKSYFGIDSNVKLIEESVR